MNVGIGAKAIVTDHDLAFIGNVRCHPGNELQIIHRLLLYAILAMPITNLSFLFQEEEALQREERPDHVFPHPFGLRLRLCPHQAVDMEAGVPPGENALGSLRAQRLLADKHRQHLAGEDLGQPRVIGPRNLMEDARCVHSALGHEIMEIRSVMSCSFPSCSRRARSLSLDSGCVPARHARRRPFRTTFSSWEKSYFNRFLLSTHPGKKGGKHACILKGL